MFSTTKMRTTKLTKTYPRGRTRNVFSTKKMRSTQLIKTCPWLLRGHLLNEFLQRGTAGKTALAQIMHMRGFIP